LPSNSDKAQHLHDKVAANIVKMLRPRTRPRVRPWSAHF